MNAKFNPFHPPPSIYCLFCVMFDVEINILMLMSLSERYYFCSKVFFSIGPIIFENLYLEINIFLMETF